MDNTILHESLANIIYCFYFDNDSKKGLLIDSTKYLISKLKYYKKIYDTLPLTQYYIIDCDCYNTINKFKEQYNNMNNNDCYDLDIVNYNTLEDFFKVNNINYTIKKLDEELLNNINKTLESSDLTCLMDEVHFKEHHL